MLKLKIALITSALALAIAGATIAFAGGNLVKNGTFNKNTNGWSSAYQYSSIGIEAGTLKVTSTLPGWSGNQATATQCVTNIQPGNTYKLDADTFIPANQHREGYAQLQLHLMSGDNCNGYLTTYYSPANKVVGSAQHISLEGVALSGAKSALVHLVVSENITGGVDVLLYPDNDFSAAFDNVTLSKLGTGGKK